MTSPNSDTRLDGWQDISTAPKDGTEIILGAPAQEFQGKPVAPRTTVGHWTSDEECQEYIGDCGGECRCPEYKYHDPYWIMGRRFHRGKSANPLDAITPSPSIRGETVMADDASFLPPDEQRLYDSVVHSLRMRGWSRMDAEDAAMEKVIDRRDRERSHDK